MNDRELLEKAARAIELELRFETRMSFDGKGKLPVIKRGNVWVDWDPLTDDGDALRLAVKLQIRVEPIGDWAVAYAGSVCAQQFSEPVRDLANPYAATRHAIVRAAAAIADQRKERT